MATSDKKTFTTKYNTRAAVRKGASEPVVTKKKENNTDSKHKYVSDDDSDGSYITESCI